MQSTLAFPICKLLQIKYKHSNLIYISSDSVSFKIKQTVESYNIYNFCTIYIYKISTKSSYFIAKKTSQAK